MIDQYGRSVTVETIDEIDVYTIADEQGMEFTVSYPTGTEIAQVLSTINAMAPQS